MYKYGHNEIKGLTIKSDNTDMESLTDCIKVDFANKKFGGGALRSGLVQE